MPERRSAESRKTTFQIMRTRTTMRMWAGVLAAVCVMTAPAVQAQSYSAFGFKPPANLIVPAFSDEELGGLLTTLDGLVAGPTPAGNDAVWQFGRRLQTGRLSAAQEARVLTHLDGLAQSNAALGAAIGGTRRVIQQLTVGKPAPD